MHLDTEAQWCRVWEWATFPPPHYPVIVHWKKELYWALLSIDFTVTAFVERQIELYAASESSESSDHSCAVSVQEYPVLCYLLGETAFTSIFPEADRKNKYESEDSVERKAQRGADFDSPDLFRFSLKEAEKMEV